MLGGQDDYYGSSFDQRIHRTHSSSASFARPTVKRLIPPAASSPSVAAAMRGNRAKDTGPELTLRSALWRAGLKGFRKHVGGLPGRPDIIYGKRQTAIFVHGCFWHSCPRCKIRNPRTNSSYWREKLRRNKIRDRIILREIRRLGWRPLRFWECEIRASLNVCLAKVRRSLSLSMRSG